MRSPPAAGTLFDAAPKTLYSHAPADTSFLPDKAREELAEVAGRLCFCLLF